jgi:transcriptional regulator with XRE-family HTH domain
MGMRKTEKETPSEGKSLQSIFDAAWKTGGFWAEDARLDLSEGLSDLMREQGITRAQLCERTGLSRRALARLLGGTFDRISLGMLSEVLACFGYRIGISVSRIPELAAQTAPAISLSRRDAEAFRRDVESCAKEMSEVQAGCRAKVKELLDRYGLDSDVSFSGDTYVWDVRGECLDVYGLASGGRLIPVEEDRVAQLCLSDESMRSLFDTRDRARGNGTPGADAGK